MWANNVAVMIPAPPSFNAWIQQQYPVYPWPSAPLFPAPMLQHSPPLSTAATPILLAGAGAYLSPMPHHLPPSPMAIAATPIPMGGPGVAYLPPGRRGGSGALMAVAHGQRYAPGRATPRGEGKKHYVYLGNLPREAPQVEQAIHDFVLSLGIQDHTIEWIRACHRRSQRQFAKISLNSKQDKLKLIRKNGAFLFNRFLLIEARCSNLISGQGRRRVCRTCGCKYAARGANWCEECAQATSLIEGIRESWNCNAGYTRDNVVQVLQDNNVHPRNVHRRVFLKRCPKPCCGDAWCNYSHSRREVKLGEILHEFRQVEEDIAAKLSENYPTTPSSSSGGQQPRKRRSIVVPTKVDLGCMRTPPPAAKPCKP